ncbi:MULTISPECIES: TIGR03118 family protein [unclassified Chamaesiphon]|uniref:TIGR03118 family protein n=1 Tax=unclassified Chamaesiphon TaxID=2620921 RepID=UPI00286C6434|nr:MULTISPECIES: TIGR03118 family protein [unclassified Chamaesiphon]
MADSVSTVFDKTNILGLLNSKLSGNSYVRTNLVANDEKYDPQILEPTFLHGWGISHRPSGVGGHFWVVGNGSGISYQYVGDVNGSPLFQDEIGEMTVPAGQDGSQGSPTGTVFNQSSNFVITQDAPNGAITAPTKFFFASINGIISAWTERKKEDGTFDWPLASIPVIDNSAKGAQYFGVAVDKAGNHLYAVDASDNHTIDVFDGNFKDITSTVGFVNPFDGGDGVQVGEYAPFNIQTLTNKDGKESVFVTYATTREAPPVNSSIFFGAPPDPSDPLSSSKIAEFDTEGNLLQIWDDGGLLEAAWGVAYAPDNFGGLSDTLLVSSFASGKVTAFDPDTKKAIGYLNDEEGKTLEVDGIWGMLFGNGASLGDTDSLYFAAGPEGATDGVFGRLRWDNSQPLLPKDAQIADFTQVADKLLAQDPTIFGGDGDDVLHGTAESSFFQAGQGNNTLFGSNGDNVFAAADGNNIAYGSGGADLFYLGNGDNTMFGGQGIGVFMAGDGNNIAYGGADRDLFLLGDGHNTVYTGNGINIVTTGKGDDIIYGGSEQDYIYTGAGDDLIFGGEGNNVLSAGIGNDTVYLGNGTDKLILDIGEGAATFWNFNADDSISLGSTAKKTDSITTQLCGLDTQIFAGGDLLATLLNTQGNIQIV